MTKTYHLQHVTSKMPYALSNGQVLRLDSKEQIERFKNGTQFPNSWEVIESDDDVGTIYNYVTICEADVKRALSEAGYKPTKENADKVGHSYAVRKAWSENDGSCWLDHINYGIDEVKQALEKTD
jgi:hypothetical protein